MIFINKKRWKSFKNVKNEFLYFITKLKKRKNVFTSMLEVTSLSQSYCLSVRSVNVSVLINNLLYIIYNNIHYILLQYWFE